MATERDTIINDRKGFSLNTSMSIRKRIIPQMTMNNGIYNQK
jgi:hypothetical protein